MLTLSQKHLIGQAISEESVSRILALGGEHLIEDGRLLIPLEEFTFSDENVPATEYSRYEARLTRIDGKLDWTVAEPGYCMKSTIPDKMVEAAKGTMTGYKSALSTKVSGISGRC